MAGGATVRTTTWGNGNCNAGPEEGSDRVVRGGSWLDDAEGCRSADRGRGAPGFRFHRLGFRLARRV
ncbi:MAG: SUMF1/EgtB/PvdO family nonheme iron enzyme [Candidatus Competibacter sp.]|nr:SUMF1/EgtB/PvdO family nonheme iron enzyme [Candidatus Competibacter sp.]